MRTMRLSGVLLLCLAAIVGCGGGGGSPTSTPVSVNTLDGETGIPLASTFQYTFAQAVTASTVTTSTFFLVPLAAPTQQTMNAKASYDANVCVSTNAIAATVSCTGTTACTLTPTAALTAGTDYAACVSPEIQYASGTAFEGFLAIFQAQATQCDNSAISSYSYLMAFMWCTDVNDSCNDPRNHNVSLAGSNDGVSWSLISEFTSIPGSVPDVFFYNDFLYVIHTQGGNRNWQKYNACFQQVSSGQAQIVGTDSGGFVDPSVILSGDSLYLFYLPGVTNGDPAGCSTYPCTKAIHSAIADSAMLNNFTQQAGDRVALELTDDPDGYRTFSDPDIIQASNGSYLLYVSIGQSVAAYTGTSLDGSFSIPGGGTTPVLISANSGGVPTALARPDGSVWLYVSYSSMGQPGVIRRAVSSDGVTPLADSAFTQVMSSSISSSFTTDTGVGSPSIIEWPPSTWSKDQPAGM